MRYGCYRPFASGWCKTGLQNERSTILDVRIENRPAIDRCLIESWIADHLWICGWPERDRRQASRRTWTPNREIAAIDDVLDAASPR